MKNHIEALYKKNTGRNATYIAPNGTRYTAMYVEWLERLVFQYEEKTRETEKAECRAKRNL